MPVLDPFPPDPELIRPWSWNFSLGKTFACKLHQVTDGWSIQTLIRVKAVGSQRRDQCTRVPCNPTSQPSTAINRSWKRISCAVRNGVE